MYRIALSKMLIFVRLVIIVSLAGYTLSNANAAMHGAAFPEFETTTSQLMKQNGEHDMAQMSGHDHAHSDAADDEDGVTKLVKQECCKDFCGGFAIMAGGHAVGGPVVSSIRHIIDDQHSFGELPALHRPPNI
jgi:hypothetical protein